MTNRDKINALSNIELAGFLGRDGTNCSICIYMGKGCRENVGGCKRACAK